MPANTPTSLQHRHAAPVLLMEDQLEFMIRQTGALEDDSADSASTYSSSCSDSDYDSDFDSDSETDDSEDSDEEDDEVDPSSILNMSVNLNLSGSILQDIEKRMSRTTMYIQRSSVSATMPNPEYQQNDQEKRERANAPGNDATLFTPQEQLDEILKDARCPQQSYTDFDWEKHFLPVTPDRTRGYSLELSKAVRSIDMPYLRNLAAKTTTSSSIWNACNQQGESLIHLAVRRQDLELVEFLLLQNQASLWVRDDYGKTPLHEACWSHKPNFAVLRLLLNKAPSLLFAKDRRGFTPLQYVPRDVRDQWTQFLKEQAASLKLNVQILGFRHTSDQLCENQNRLQALLQKHTGNKN